MEVNSAKDTRSLFTALSMLQLHNAIGDQIFVFDTKSKKPIASYTVLSKGTFEFMPLSGSETHNCDWS